MTAGVARAGGGARRRGALGALPLAPAGAWFLLFFLGPLLVLVAFSFFDFRNYAWTADLNLDNYLEALTDTGFRTILLRTISIALVVTGVVLLVAYPFTYVVTFVFPRRRQWLYFLVLVTLFGSYLVRIYAWRTILGTEGLLNAALLQLGLIAEPITALIFSPWAVIVTLVGLLLPLSLLPIWSSMSNVGRDHVEAARDLGSNGLRLHRTVILPMVLPGVGTAFAIAFVLAAGDFVVPTMVGGAQGGTMIGNLITNFFRSSSADWPLGAALAFVVMGLLVLVYLLTTRLLRWVTRR